MKFLKLPPLALAIVLQLVPLCRVACVNHGAAPAGFAILFRWIAGAGVLLETVDAVSGASAAVAGMQNLNPVGPLTTTATGSVGQVFVYRIIVTNPGQNPDQAFYNVVPLPPGLTINTNIAANGGTNAITGKPTAGGSYAVTLIAGNANYSNTVTLGATINIQGSGAGPSITGPPTNSTVTAGQTASFTVTASGTAPLAYQWRFNSNNITSATNGLLTLNNVRTNQAGNYSVVVTNSGGSAISPAAHLAVTIPPAPVLTLSPRQGNQLLLSFVPVVGLTNTVFVAGAMSNGGWNLLTNFPPPTSAASLSLTDSVTGTVRFYRMKFDP